MTNSADMWTLIPKLKDEIYKAILKYSLSEYESEITDFDTELQYYKDCQIAGEIEKHISIYSNLLKDEEKYYRMKFSPKIVEHSLETILKEHCERMKIDIDNVSMYEVYDYIESPDRKFGPQQLCDESRLNGNNDVLYNVLKNNAIITKLAQHISLVQVLIELKRRKQENEENLQKANAKKVPEREIVATMSDKVHRTTISFFEVEVKETEKQKLLEYLKITYSSAIGKNIAIMILALKEAGMIKYNKRKELYSALREDFGEIGSDQSINAYIIEKNSGNTKKDKDYRTTISEHAERIKNYNNK